MASADSEQGYDFMFCEPCHKEGNRVQADGFCVNCLDYMCNTCLKYHKKYVRNHTHLDKANMPQDFCVERCSVHPNEFVKFYCPRCDDTTCPECIPIKHQAECSEFKHIPSYLQSRDIKSEFKEVQKTLNKVEKEATRMREETDENLKQVSINRGDISKSINRQRKYMKDRIEDQRIEIFKSLDEEKAEIIRKLEEKQNQRKQQLFEQQKFINTRIEEEARKLDEQSKTYPIIMHKMASKSVNIESKLTSLIGELGLKERQGQKAELFITTKKIKHKMKALERDMNDVREESVVSYHKFRPNKNDVNIDAPEESVHLGSLSRYSRKSNTKATTSYYTIIFGVLFVYITTVSVVTSGITDASNNSPPVIASYFLETVKELGIVPRLLRCDRGTENAKLALLQPFYFQIRRYRQCFWFEKLHVWEECI
ncbi:uncharacterized protein LOC123538008 [Mercenaria mercenaria]|uniref:uncharacterized protein LOC123538008 n=1 Tax=Mercenaria mercenaria TaxID=6596 RepID=UPI00234FB58E|nr:uncharacterized protein LOC123538008 [Mercenaria mercenaria]